MSDEMRMAVGTATDFTGGHQEIDGVHYIEFAEDEEGKAGWTKSDPAVCKMMLGQRGMTCSHC